MRSAFARNATPQPSVHESMAKGSGSTPWPPYMGHLDSVRHGTPVFQTITRLPPGPTESLEDRALRSMMPPISLAHSATSA